MQLKSYQQKRYVNTPLTYLFLCLILLAVYSNVFAECNILGKNKLSSADIAIAEKVSYKHIYDGDTILLGDGRKVRFIGINTPEIGRKNKPSQPYAKKAKQKLKSLLKSSSSLLLLYDKDKKDRYKRTLAYVYLADGTDVQAEILGAGLALSIVVNPNDKHLKCYRQIERQARNRYLGIWKQKKLRPISAKKLTTAKQYRFVSGKVTSIKTRSKYLIIKLDQSVSVKLSDQAFASYQHQHLLGKKIQLRGWVYKHKKQAAMSIYHPENMTIY